MSHYAINDGLALLLNLIIDVMLVVHIRSDLSKKLEISGHSGKKEIEKKKKEKETTERKMNKMIVYQLILYFFCRLPELVFYAHFLFLKLPTDLTVFDFPYIFFCCESSFCSLLLNVIQYVYMVSYSLNVYFMYQFNKTFRTALKQYLKTKIVCHR